MSFEHIIALLTTYKYLFLFPITIIEGPIITVIAGFLSSLGYLNVYIVFAVVVTGDIVGDAIYYAFGYYSGTRLIKRWGRFVGITTERVENLEKHFETHAGKTLIIGKLSHAVGSVVLVGAGIAKVPFWKFIWYNLISTLPKSLVFLLIGFYFGQAYEIFDKYLGYATVILILLVIICVIVYFGMKKLSQKYEEKT